MANLEVSSASNFGVSSLCCVYAVVQKPDLSYVLPLAQGIFNCMWCDKRAPQDKSG